MPSNLSFDGLLRRACMDGPASPHSSSLSSAPIRSRLESPPLQCVTARLQHCDPTVNRSLLKMWKLPPTPSTCSSRWNSARKEMRLEWPREGAELEVTPTESGPVIAANGWNRKPHPRVFGWHALAWPPSFAFSLRTPKLADPPSLSCRRPHLAVCIANVRMRETRRKTRWSVAGQFNNNDTTAHGSGCLGRLHGNPRAWQVLGNSYTRHT